MSQPAVDLLRFQLKVAGLPQGIPEFVFARPRKWPFDLLLPHRLAVEVDGGGWIGGRHARGQGIENDCEKYAYALMLGYRVLRVTPAQVKSGAALTWIASILANAAAEESAGPPPATPAHSRGQPR